MSEAPFIHLTRVGPIDSDEVRFDAPIVDVRPVGTQRPDGHRKELEAHDMREHRGHRSGHPAGIHVASSRVHSAASYHASVAPSSVKPSGSWHVSTTFATAYRTTGFSKTGQRPRGATS